MTQRICFDDSAESPPKISVFEPVLPAPPPARQLALAEWDRSAPSILKLYLEDEPEVGQVFRYNGLDWQIVEYRNGWIARLIVE